MNRTRIVKVDQRNFAVQKFVTVESRVKLRKTGEVREEWQDSGYFGHRLDQAARFALLDSFEDGEQVTPQLVEKAVAQIVSESQLSFKGAA